MMNPNVPKRPAIFLFAQFVVPNDHFVVLSKEIRNVSIQIFRFFPYSNTNGFDFCVILINISMLFFHSISPSNSILFRYSSFMRFHDIFLFLVEFDFLFSDYSFSFILILIKICFNPE